MQNTTTTPKSAAPFFSVQYRGWGGYGWVWFIAMTTESEYKAERRARAIRRTGRDVRVMREEGWQK